MCSNEQTEIELRISKEIRKTGTFERIKLIPAFLLSSEIFLIRSFANRRPSAARPGVAAADN
jgi:hypothetical protein